MHCRQRRQWKTRKRLRHSSLCRTTAPPPLPPVPPRRRGVTTARTRPLNRQPSHRCPHAATTAPGAVRRVSALASRLPRHALQLAVAALQSDVARCLPPRDLEEVAYSRTTMLLPQPKVEVSACAHRIRPKKDMQTVSVLRPLRRKRTPPMSHTPFSRTMPSQIPTIRSSSVLIVERPRRPPS